MLRVALIHDWLTGMRGGEKALEVFCEMFPAADLFTLVYLPGTTSPTIERRSVKRSAIQWLPMAGKLYRQYLPLFPIAVEQFDLDGYDLVISTSHCAAKSVVVTGRARHLCYCLTPMRYAWDQFDAYFGIDRVGKLGNLVLRPVLAGLARWDRATAGRVHRYLAISQYVARRIALYYNRQSTLVYPPVDTDFYSADHLPAGPAPPTQQPKFLVVSALVPYKRVDLAMMAARQAGVGSYRGGQWARAREPRAARRRRHRAARVAHRRRDPRFVSRLDGDHPARRRGLRHRARGSAGLRPAGRRAWPRRRTRHSDRRRDRRVIRGHHRRLARRGIDARRGHPLGRRANPPACGGLFAQPLRHGDPSTS